MLPLCAVDQLLYKLFGIFLHMGDLSISHLPTSFIYLFNHLFLSLWAHGYSFHSLCYKQYYLIFLLKLFLLQSLGTLSVGSCAPFTYPHQGCFSLHFLTFQRSKMLHAHVVYSLPKCQKQPFLEGALVPFIEE